MPDPYTPVDMAAIDLILAEYLRADVAARVSIRIAEAIGAGAREARRKAASAATPRRPNSAPCST